MIFFLISTPVMSFTIVGRLPMIDSICTIINEQIGLISRVTTRYPFQCCVSWSNWRRKFYFSRIVEPKFRILYLSVFLHQTLFKILFSSIQTHLLREFARPNRSVSGADHRDLVRLGEGSAHFGCHSGENLGFQNWLIDTNWVSMFFMVWCFTAALIETQCG